MPEPTHVPTREVPTEWGLMYATCVHPHRVRFSTNLTVAGGESSLIINRIKYSCTVVLTRAEIPQDRRSRYRPVDDTWHAESDWYSFRRYGTLSDPTANARAVLHDQVLPTLGRWLRSGDAHELLNEGATHWRRHCRQLAATAEQKLTQAFHHLQDLRKAVDDGRVLTPDQERFLDHPHLLRFPHERYPQPTSPTTHT